ncbi:hypothetical protein KCP91_12105 [Microvirga sp. SRT01]|uniref:Phage tail protein n=1 Tax=Sphingomonas longa TaxID=2778730 RepID=A0ABS2D863_9SPHN|nr:MULTISPECIES: hypothetical protein [Alphaproteobacteria]MBM6577116.1 hypothetical protein [Sphingomonas sp. BT552]MBR7710160.1 hypothetical protein [Microvirga sp. SRT01]
MATGITTAKTKFEWKVGTGAAVKIGGVVSFSGLGGGSSAVIDTTDFDSTAKEKAMGLPDEGQVSLSMILIPGDAGQTALGAARSAQTKGTLIITLSDKTIYTQDAFVLTFERNGEQDDVAKASCNLEITGAIVQSKGV